MPNYPAWRNLLKHRQYTIEELENYTPQDMAFQNKKTVDEATISELDSNTTFVNQSKSSAPTWTNNTKS